MVILGIVMKIISVIFGFYWLKNAASKIKRPYMYFIAIKDYGVQTKPSILIVFVSFIIAAEVLVALLFLTTLNSYFSVGIALVLLAMQTSLLAKRIHQTYENNCGCFANAPKTVTMKHLMNQIVLIVLLIIYLGIDTNFVNGG